MIACGEVGSAMVLTFVGVIVLGDSPPVVESVKQRLASAKSAVISGRDASGLASVRPVSQTMSTSGYFV